MKQKIKFNFQVAKMNLTRIIRSTKFLYSVIAIIAVLFMALIELNLESVHPTNVCEAFQLILNFTFFSKVAVLISALPAVTGFCDDWNTQYIRLNVGRIGVRKYAVHKVYACIIGTFLTAFAAYTVFVLLLLLKYPITSDFTTENLSAVFPLGKILPVSPFLYLIMRITCYSASCTLWASFGLAFSAYFPNRFVACSMPLLFCYLSETILLLADTRYNAPAWMLLPYLSVTGMTCPVFGNSVIDFLYIVCLFIGLAVFVSGIFIRGVERRMRNELV